MAPRVVHITPGNVCLWCVCVCARAHALNCIPGLPLAGGRPPPAAVCVCVCVCVCVELLLQKAQVDRRQERRLPTAGTLTACGQSLFGSLSPSKSMFPLIPGASCRYFGALSALLQVIQTMLPGKPWGFFETHESP